MTEFAGPDRARTAALDRIDQAERAYKFGIVGVAVCEFLFGGAYLLLMDFRDRLHWLILLAALLTYSVVLGGVINLGRYLNASTRAVLTAALARDRGEGGTG